MTTGLFPSRSPTAQGIAARNHQRKRRAAHNDRRLDDFAELIAEDMSVEGAAVRLGCAPDSDIGEVISQLLGVHPERWRMRFSGHDGPRDGAVVVDQASETEHLICPAQLDPTGQRCCSTCALCWHSDRTIAFLRH